jgi:hypothetical protein
MSNLIRKEISKAREVVENMEGRVGPPLLLWFLGLPGGLCLLLWFFVWRGK